MTTTGSTGSVEVTLSQRIQPFGRYLTVIGESEDEVKRLFEETQITEVRERCLDAMFEKTPAQYGVGWVEGVISEARRIGATAIQERIFEWYLTRSAGLYLTDGAHALRFAFALIRQNKIQPAFAYGVVNQVIKAHSALYWSTDEIVDRYIEHFKTLTDGGMWRQYSLEEWNEAERCIRRIVEAGDVRFRTFLKEWMEKHESGPLLLQRELLPQKDGRPRNWEVPGRILAFLKDAVRVLTEAEEKQKPGQGVAEFLITFYNSMKHFGFTDAFEILFDYPPSEVINRAVISGTTVDVSVVTQDRRNVPGNIEPLKQLWRDLRIDLAIEGGHEVEAWSPLSRDFCRSGLGSFNPKNGSVCFRFTPLARRNRLTLSFYSARENKVIGQCVQYRPSAPLHVWG